MRIWGTNSSTAPTPPMMPLPRRPASIRFGTAASTYAARDLKASPRRSCSGAAQVNRAWKNRNITAKKMIVPHTGCSRTRSMRSVRASGVGAS